MSGSGVVPLFSAGDNKIKKSKSDLQATVGIFLNQKNMNIDKYRRSEVISLQNKRSFMLQKMLETDTCNGNSFVYSNVISMPNHCYLIDEQFGRFTQFVESREKLLRNELRRFYAPMICHLYLDLLKAEETKSAINFMKKYAHLVAPVETYEAPLNPVINGSSVQSSQLTDFPLSSLNHVDLQQIEEKPNINGITCSESEVCNAPWRLNYLNIRFAISNSNHNNVNTLEQHEQKHNECDNSMEEGVDPELEFFVKLIQKLSVSQNIEALQMDADIVQFFSSKYELHSSGRVMKELLSYLENNGHVLLLHLIINCIHVRILDHEVQNLSEENILMPANEDMNEFDNCTISDNASGDINKIERDIVKKDIDKDDIKPPTANITSKKRSNSFHASNNNIDEDIEQNVEPSLETEQLLKIDSPILSSNNKLKTTVQHCLQTFREKREKLTSNSSDISARVIQINDRGLGLCGASLDSKECHLVGGFNNSTIRLWQMNGHCTVGGSLYASRSCRYCHWDLNHTQSEDRDEMLMDIRKNHSVKKQNYLDEYNTCQYYDKKYVDNSYNIFGGIHLRGHRAGVTSVKFSLHYPLLYSVSKDGDMRCWRAEDLECGGIYKGHRYPIWCMDESPVGMYLATGSKDLTARLWSLEKNFPLITYIGHTQDVECVAFHPNGNYLATGSSDHSVRLWCVTSGKLMRVFSECKQAICSLIFSPDGKMLAAGGEESKVRIFDLAAGAQINELNDHTATVISLAWSKNGHRIATGSCDGTLQLWNVNNLETTLLNTSTSNYKTNSTSSKAAASLTKKTATSNISSLEEAAAANTLNRETVLSVSCKRLVKIFFDNNDRLSCLTC